MTTAKVSGSAGHYSRFPQSWALRPFDRFAGYEARALLIHSGNFIGYLSKEYVEHMGWQEQMRPLQKRGLNYSNQYAAIVGKHAGQSPVNQAFIECLTQ